MQNFSACMEGTLIGLWSIRIIHMLVYQTAGECHPSGIPACPPLRSTTLCHSTGLLFHRAHSCRSTNP
ncbi:unnamed protein product, partial [Iphiclides podalirius]